MYPLQSLKTSHIVDILLILPEKWTLLCNYNIDHWYTKWGWGQVNILSEGHSGVAWTLYTKYSYPPTHNWAVADRLKWGQAQGTYDRWKP